MTRSFAFSGVVLLATLVGSAGAVPEANLLIRPAQGIGKLQLGMTAVQVRRAMGSPNAVVRHPAQSGFESIEYQYDFASYTVRLFGKPGRMHAVQVTTVLRRERTPEGLGPGSLERDVIRAYPRISCEPLNIVIVAGVRHLQNSGRDCTLPSPSGRRTVFRSLVHVSQYEPLTPTQYLERARVDEVLVVAAGG